ncbi:ABC transporter permease [Inquilinus sp. CAU 1745]|uniref:ABC transporter permease n=1 Tax=Inquilinus sp. CAU 1745 TaxID=3140369 RepID=UPI00325B938F
MTEASPRRRMAIIPKLKGAQTYGALAALIALLLFNALFTPNFLTLQTLNVNLIQVTTIVIVAVGMTMVIATGGIDLSVGSLMAIGGALAPLIFLSDLPLLSSPAIGVPLAIVLPILTAGLFGLFNGWLITRFSIQPIIATLVLFIAGRGIAQVMTNGNLQTFSNDSFQFLGLGRVLGIPFQVLIMIAIVIAASWIMRRTVFGRQVLAIGGNEAAARLSGIPINRVKWAVYAIVGLLSGLAGLIVIAINSSSDANQIGLGMELDAIAAVVVGGTALTGGKATIVGTLIGALIIQFVGYTLLAHGIPDAAALVVKAGIILLAVYVQRRDAP